MSLHEPPTIISSFMHKTGEVTIEWHDIPLTAKLPKLPWQQVYVIGSINGKVPIVHYENGGDNLPGGKTELDETVSETIHREIREELNCSVSFWTPLGYQICKEGDGKTLYQLRVAAELEVLGPFQNDPGGLVIGYSLVNLKDLNKYICYGEVGERLVQLSAKTDITYR